jgi:uridine kinase
VDLVDRLVAAIIHRTAESNRTLVAIDGLDAAGKTTLANRLAERLAATSGLAVIRASIDDFHHCKADRWRRGPLSGEGYYRDTFDFATLASDLLEPFRAGHHTARTASLDYGTDEVVETQAAVPERAVLIVDGVFLQRDELCGFWSLTIYLRISPETALRGVPRDTPAGGSAHDVEERYLSRYLPGQALYVAEVDPESRADIVVDNTHPDAPQVIRE